MQDYDYITLYLPCEGQLTHTSVPTALREDCMEWLSENVGAGTVSEMRWLLGAEAREFEWCYCGIEYKENKRSRRFYFRDINKATLFKLTWGG